MIVVAETQSAFCFEQVFISYKDGTILLKLNRKDSPLFDFFFTSVDGSLWLLA